jgi:hypothetical protein
MDNKKYWVISRGLDSILADISKQLVVDNTWILYEDNLCKSYKNTPSFINDFYKLVSDHPFTMLDNGIIPSMELSPIRNSRISIKLRVLNILIDEIIKYFHHGLFDLNIYGDHYLERLSDMNKLRDLSLQVKRGHFVFDESMELYIQRYRIVKKKPELSLEDFYMTAFEF